MQPPVDRMIRFWFAYCKLKKNPTKVVVVVMWMGGLFLGNRPIFPNEVNKYTTLNKQIMPN